VVMVGSGGRVRERGVEGDRRWVTLPAETRVEIWISLYSRERVEYSCLRALRESSTERISRGRSESRDLR